MKINFSLLPVKAHYFFFMASMGPILPQISVYGKQLGISPEIMGSVTGILPIMFLLAKPCFGFVADRFRTHRKHIFVALIIGMGIMYAGLYFVPVQDNNLHLQNEICVQTMKRSCNVTDVNEKVCKHFYCTLSERNETFMALQISETQEDICIVKNNYTYDYRSCNLQCQGSEMSLRCTLTSYRFWCFVILMCSGTIGFNVINSISDAICFDVLGTGQEMSYGKQRVWGTIGFGISALLSGYIVDWWSVGDVKSFTPALVIMMAFLFIDILCCKKLKLPVMETPKNIIKDVIELLKLIHIKIFIIFAILAGAIDSFFIYFFFWYLEELATETGHIHHIKLLEGIIVAAETLGGEVLFFSVSGSILRVIGYGHTLTLVFICYTLRFGLISIISSPWWAIPVEFMLQGPTYALGYTTIVAYASAVSPPGTSATMQGLVAGMDDGFGYAIGSFFTGVLYKRLGGKTTLKVFSGLALGCAGLHALLYFTVLKNKIPSTKDSVDVEYHEPQEAVKQTQQAEEVRFGDYKQVRNSYHTF